MAGLGLYGLDRFLFFFWGGGGALQVRKVWHAFLIQRLGSADEGPKDWVILFEDVGLRKRGTLSGHVLRVLSFVYTPDV